MDRVTLKDIAKLAGVSIKTVSRVTNNHKYVSKQTRQKVMEVLAKHDYFPNLAARSLVLNRIDTLGLIVPFLENPFYSRLSRGVVQTAEENNFSVIVCESKFSPTIGEKYLRMLIERGVDGLLIATLDLDDVFMGSLIHSGKPFVVMTCKVDRDDISYVIADDYRAGREVVEYLIELGHQNIAFLKGPDVYSSNERFTAYRDVMDENGLPLPDYLITKNILQKNEAYGETKKLLSRHKNITAIVGNNDYTTLGAIKAIKDMGLGIPEDISVVGYDDIDITELLDTPLTTVHYPKFTCGQKATQMIIDMLNEEKSESRKIVLKTNLIKRGSCGPAKSKTAKAS